MKSEISFINDSSNVRIKLQYRLPSVSRTFDNPNFHSPLSLITGISVLNGASVSSSVAAADSTRSVDAAEEELSGHQRSAAVSDFEDGTFFFQ